MKPDENAAAMDGQASRPDAMGYSESEFRWLERPSRVLRATSTS